MKFMPSPRNLGLLAAALFIGTVWAANYAVTHWGFTSVGFGLTAPAGVWFAGLAFTLRDIVHRMLGRVAVIACIFAGALLSILIEANTTIPGGHVSVAVASAIAFLISELSDLAVYEPLHEHGWTRAVVASNVVGFILDSIIFVTLAFGWNSELIKGQIVGKAWMTLAVLPVVWYLRRYPRRREAIA
jgi:uncharacterized PurR-regulated membrane protein YhhQ (DUF165 family)